MLFNDPLKNIYIDANINYSTCHVYTFGSYWISALHTWMHKNHVYKCIGCLFLAVTWFIGYYTVILWYMRSLKTDNNGVFL